MTAGEGDGRLDDGFDVIKIIKRIGDFGGLSSEGNFDGFGIVLIKNEVIFGGLEFGDIGFGFKVVVVIFVDVEVVGLEVAEDGDVGRFIKVPELKTR